MGESASGRLSATADLHLHSAVSDGTETPAAVVAAAWEQGVRTLSLTDHDTTGGWAPAAAATRERGMTLVPGMELSTRVGHRSVHLLAYLFDPDDAALSAEMSRIRDDRVGRAERMVDNIARDYDLAWEDVIAQTGDGTTVGRPHIADALIARGIVADRAAAFAGILHPREGYYVDHYAPETADAIRLVRAAGGVPIAAHVMAGARSRMPRDLLLGLVDAGLGGFEVDHRENPPAGRELLRRIVAEHDLIATGSSDYHGAGKPNTPGENTTPLDQVERIIAEATGTPPVYP